MRILVLGGGNLVGTLISAVALIIFSRLLGPSEFGLFSAAFALMQIIVRLIDSGTTVAVERTLARAYAQKPNATHSIMITSAYIKFALYLFWLILGLTFARYLTFSYLGITDLNLIKTAIIISVGTVIFEYATIIFQATNNFALVARITITQALGKLIGGLILLSQSALTATTALWLYGLMPAIGSLAGWLHSPYKLSTTLPDHWQKDLRLILATAKWTAIATLGATIAENLDTLIVQSMLSLHDTGIWAATTRIAAFANLLPWTVGSVLSIRLTNYKAKTHLQKYLRKSILISLVSALIVLFCIPFSSLALKLTVGTSYLSGGTTLMLTLVATALTAAVTPYASLYYLLDRPQYYAYTGLISTILLIMLDYILIPTLGINGAAVTRICVRLILLIFTIVYTKLALSDHLKSNHE